MPEGLLLNPFLLWLPDPDFSLNAPQALELVQSSGSPRSGAGLFRQNTDAVWLYAKLGSLPYQDSAKNQPFVLDLGDQAPSGISLWFRPPNSTALHEVQADENDLFPLPVAALSGEVLVRLEGQPGLWFAPRLRTLSEALAAPEHRTHSLALAALAVLFLLCVTRSVTERGDGRIWAAIFAGAALLQALSGLPATRSSGLRYIDMPGILAAGVALMLLPHVGRNIMRTREYSPGADSILLILAVPGAALGLLPFLPGLSWTARLVPLWPLGASLSLLPALFLLKRGLAGSGLFALACLSMSGGTLLALWGMDSMALSLWAQGPLIGLVLAVLLLAAAPSSAFGEVFGVIDLDQTDADPSFSQAEPDSFANLDQNALKSSLRLEEHLRPQLDALLREACALDQILGGQLSNSPSSFSGSSGSQSPSQQGTFPGRPFIPGAPRPINAPLPAQDALVARHHADKLVAASRELSTLIADIPHVTARGGGQIRTSQNFQPRKLVEAAFASIREEAERKGVGLSWYVAPYLGQSFQADSDRLRLILRLLLTDALRATACGVISLRLRRSPNSLNPGHLQFSVADTGTGQPPLHRSSLMLARAWELAAAHGGELSVKNDPFGMEINFSMDCMALDSNGEEIPHAPAITAMPPTPGEPDPSLVLLVSPSPRNRHLFAWYLQEQGQRLWEARDTEEAVTLYAHSPAALVILDGHLSEEGMVTAIAVIRAFEGEHLLPPVPFLALTVDTEQADRLRQAGCDNALIQPILRDDLQATTRRLISPDASPDLLANPSPSAHTPSAKFSPISPESLPYVIHATAPAPNSLGAGSQASLKTPAEGLAPAPQATPEPDSTFAPVPPVEPGLTPVTGIAPESTQDIPASPPFAEFSATHSAQATQPAQASHPAQTSMPKPGPANLLRKSSPPDIQQPTMDSPTNSEPNTVSESVRKTETDPAVAPPSAAPSAAPAAAPAVAPAVAPDFSLPHTRTPSQANPALTPLAHDATSPATSSPLDISPLAPLPNTPSVTGAEKSGSNAPKTSTAAPAQKSENPPSPAPKAPPAASGLNMAPAKKRGWLSLFKPTPKISSDDAPALLPGGDWVGNPVPLGTPPAASSTPQTKPVPEADAMPSSFLAPHESAVPASHEEEYGATIPSAPTAPTAPLSPSAPALPASGQTLLESPVEAPMPPEPQNIASAAPKAEASQSMPTPAQPSAAQASAVQTLAVQASTGQSRLSQGEYSIPTPKAPSGQSSKNTPEIKEASRAPKSSRQRSRHRKNRMEDLPFLSLDPLYTSTPQPKEPGFQADATQKTRPNMVAEALPEILPETFPEILPKKLPKKLPEGLPDREADTAQYRGQNSGPDIIAYEEPDSEDIVDLTEADMLDAPLLPSLDQDQTMAIPSPYAQAEYSPDLILQNSPEAELYHNVSAALERAKNAMHAQDAQNLALIAAQVTAQATNFGLHSLSDLATCLQEAAQQHDFDAVDQLLADLRTEASRLRPH